MQATDKLPTIADLSSCQLEYLPENIFVNDQLAVLNLQHNALRERPLDEDIYVIGWLEDLSRCAV
jgi:PH domain/leucine-rich repeat-containing protein phosphatase